MAGQSWSFELYCRDDVFTSEAYQIKCSQMQLQVMTLRTIYTNVKHTIHIHIYTYIRHLKVLWNIKESIHTSLDEKKNRKTQAVQAV